MTHYFHLAIATALFLAGCARQTDSPFVRMTDSPEVVAAQARAMQAGLTPSMPDEQILRKIGYDPGTLSQHRTDGIDG